MQTITAADYRAIQSLGMADGERLGAIHLTDQEIGGFQVHDRLARVLGQITGRYDVRQLRAAHRIYKTSFTIGHRRYEIKRLADQIRRSPCDQCGCVHLAEQPYNHPKF